MRFSEDFIEKVREASNIVDIISSYTELKRAGHQLMGRCPFPTHNEKTPSFSVSEDKQVYHCFGCKRGGNVYTFLQEYNGMSFPESIEFLARRASIALPEEPKKLGGVSGRPASMDMKSRRNALLKINRLAADFFQQQLGYLPGQDPARKYAESRGLDEGIFNTFQIGYAPDEWEALNNELKARKVPLDWASQLGLLKARDGREGYYDLFRDRLIFPIFAPNGDVLGFGGRVLGEGHPKYLNSPDSPIFHKGKVLYGLHETAKFIRGRDLVVIVEGYMDLISLYSVGINYVVATMGTALTEDHAKLIRRYTKNVVALFDGDEAGQRAQERSLPILLKAGLYPRGLTLAGGMDPDDFAKSKGGEELQRQIAQAPDLFDEFLRVILKSYRGGPQDQVHLVEKVGPVLAVLEDRRLLSLYIDSICRSAMVKRPWLERALQETWKANAEKAQATGEARRGLQVQPKQSLKPSAEPPSQQSPEGKIALQRAPKLELEVLRLALLDHAYFDKVNLAGAGDWLTHDGVKKLIEIAQETYRQSPDKFGNLTALLASKVDNPGMITWLENPQPHEDGRELTDKYLADCLKRLKTKYLQGKMQNLTREIKSQPSQQKLEQFLDMVREKENLN